MKEQPQDETPLEVMESQVFGLEVREEDMVDIKPRETDKPTTIRK